MRDIQKKSVDFIRQRGAQRCLIILLNESIFFLIHQSDIIGDFRQSTNSINEKCLRPVLFVAQVMTDITKQDRQLRKRWRTRGSLTFM